MAQLDNVKVIVDGTEYVKVDREAQAGDIVRHDVDGYDYLPQGSYYRVFIDEDGDAMITDEEGDDTSVDDEFTVFAPVTETTTQADDIITHNGKPYRKVARKANVGELVVIVAGTYEPGQIAECTNAGQFADGSIDIKFVNDGKTGFVDCAYEHYVVLEPVIEAKPSRLKVGEYAKVTETGALDDYRNVGDIVKITEDDRSDIPFGLEHVDGRYAGWAKVSSITRATPEEVEAARKAAMAALDPRSQFAQGDKVRLLSGGGRYPLNGYKDGEIYEVTDPFARTWDNKHVEITGGYLTIAYATPEQLVKVTEAEREITYKIGDYVKVVHHGGGHDYEIGEVVKIAELRDDLGNLFRGIKASTGQTGNTLAYTQVERATESEYEAARKPSVKVGGEYLLTSLRGGNVFGFEVGDVVTVESETRSNRYQIRSKDGTYGYIDGDHLEEPPAAYTKWSAIGRKVNEYKRGDIVRVIANTTSSVNHVGDIGKVTEGPTTRVNYRVDAGNGDFANWTHPNDMKLVTPVEQRFDYPRN